MYLFSYGTLQNRKIQKSLFGRPCQMISGKLTGYDVVEGDDGYFNLKLSEHNIIEGKLLEIDNDMLLSADQWEEVPVYERSLVSVETTLGTINAWAYFKTKEQKELDIKDQNALSGLSTSLLEEIFSDFIRLREITGYFIDVYFAMPITGYGDHVTTYKKVPERLEKFTVLNIMHEDYAIRHFGCIIDDTVNTPQLLLAVPVSIRSPQSLKVSIVDNLDAIAKTFEVTLGRDVQTMVFTSNLEPMTNKYTNVQPIDFKLSYTLRLKKEQRLLMQWLNLKS